MWPAATRVFLFNGQGKQRRETLGTRLTSAMFSYFKRQGPEQMPYKGTPYPPRRWINITYYYKSDSLWKIWLVESIQSIHNSLWTWHDKCTICSRYCIYHVKFNICLVTKPLGVFSSETKWLNVSLLFLRMNYVKNGFRVIPWIIKTSCLSVHSWYHAQPHPIIV